MLLRYIVAKESRVACMNITCLCLGKTAAASPPFLSVFELKEGVIFTAQYFIFHEHPQAPSLCYAYIFKR